MTGHDVRGTPLGAGRLAVVVLHGRDQDPGWMHEEVVARITARRPDLALTWIAPAAPGRAWYAGRVHDPLTETRDERDRAADAIEAAAALAAAHGHDATTTVLAGFSQGACLVADHLLRRPRRWAGAMIWTGAAFGPPGTVWPPGDGLAGLDGLDGLPVLASNGDADAWVPLAATEALAATLREHGADVALRVVPGRGHEVADAEIADAATLLGHLAGAC